MEQKKQVYRRMKHTIYSRGNPLAGTYALFATEPPNNILSNLDLLQSDPFLRNIIIGKPFPSQVDNIETSGRMPRFYNLDQSLCWYTLALCMQANDVNRFLEIRSKVDHAFLIGDYEQCLNYLDDCHSSFGFSLWEIKKRIAVISEMEGDEFQRAYADKIWKSMQKGGLCAYQVFYYSRQCESNLSASAYYNIIKSDYERFLREGVDKMRCNYALFKTGGNVTLSAELPKLLNPQNINYFLFEDAQYGLVDCYISLSNMLSCIFLSDDVRLQAIFVPYVKKLSAYMNDPFLKNIIFQWDHHYYLFYSYENDNICNIFDLYSSGNYQDSNCLAGAFLRSDVRFFPLIELYSKSCIHLPSFIPLTDEPSLLNTIAKKLNQLFSRTGNTKDTIVDLTKILYKHLDADWSYELKIIIDKFNSKLMVLEDCEFKNLHSSITTPDLIFDFDSVFLPRFLDQTTTIYRNSVSTQLSVAVRTCDFQLLESLNIDSSRKKRYLASLLAESKSYDSLSILDQIREECMNSAIRLEIDAIRIRAYLNLGELQKAIEIFVPTFCENSNFIYMGYIERIFDEIKAGTCDVSSSILTPIICSLYFNYYPEHRNIDDILLSICYDEYLESRGVTKPSALLENTPKSDMFIRFLAEVCIPSVMERSLTFESPDDILRERNIICNALAELDPENRGKYNDEVRRHTNTLLVRLAKRELDNGKIYVDIEALRPLLLQDVCDLVERFFQNRYDNLVTLIGNPTSVENSSICFYQITPAGLSELLEEILKKVRDIFTADNKYGLDGTLSVRIRHGTLESQIRSCFEKHKLITTKDFDGRYNPNHFWQAELDFADSINNIFSSFSEKIDSEIAFIKNELIQIRTETKKTNGWFDFSIDANLISRFEAKMYTVNTYDQFEAYVLDLMMAITENCLTTIRDSFNKEINDYFQQVLIDLETDLQAYQSVFNFQGLRVQIANARTDISAELKNISEWFRCTQSDSFMDYNLSLATELSYQTYQHAHPACSLKCAYDQIDKNIVFYGRTLRSVVDILIILLDNVVKHSGLSSNHYAKISARKEDNLLILSVENPISPGCIDTSHIMEITTQLGTWENRDIIRREGGSGLYKVKKILSVDLNCTNQITLFCKEDSFLVEIRVELGGVAH